MKSKFSFLLHDPKTKTITSVEKITQMYPDIFSNALNICKVEGDYFLVYEFPDNRKCVFDGDKILFTPENVPLISGVFKIHKCDNDQY
jgi:hypothetical protein